MIKFFRKIRQKMLTENKFSKYLIYAIGEILLVIVGILIALNINNSNEERKSNQRILSVFNDLQENLSQDLRSIKTLLPIMDAKDSIANIVLKDNLSAQGYQNLENVQYAYLTYNWNFFNATNSSFQSLLNNSGTIPENYDDIIKELNKLYKTLLKAMSETQESVQYIVDERIIRQHLEYEWFSDLMSYHINGIIPENAAKYFADSPIYRNEVALFKIRYLVNYADDLKKYRGQALRCYLILTEILGNEIDQTVLPIGYKMPSKQIKAEYEGNFKYVTQPYKVSYNSKLNLNAIGLSWEQDYYMIARDTFQNFDLYIKIIFRRDSLENVFGFDYIDRTRTLRFNKMKTVD
jgi:hypothetical protein